MGSSRLITETREIFPAGERYQLTEHGDCMLKHAATYRHFIRRLVALVFLHSTVWFNNVSGRRNHVDGKDLPETLEGVGESFVLR